MKINVTLVGRSFYFIEDFDLRKKETAEVDLSERDDNFKKRICNSIKARILTADAPIEDIVNTIESAQGRVDVKKIFGLKITDEEKDILINERANEVNSFNDEITVEPEVVSVETEEVAEDASDSQESTADPEEVVVEAEVEVDLSVEAIAPTPDRSLSDDELKEILDGSIKEVSEAVEGFALTKSDISRLQELESEGKDRAGVKSLVGDLL